FHLQVHGNAFADFRGLAVALARSGDVQDPVAGQKAAQHQEAEQDVHGVRQQPGAQHKRRQQEEGGAEVPLHRNASSAGAPLPLSTGTETSLRISWITAVVETFRSRLSGFRIRRWPSTDVAMRLTSSGKTKSRLPIAASACP